MHYRATLLLLLLSLFSLWQSGTKQDAPPQQKHDEAKTIPAPVVAQPTTPQQQGQSDKSCKIPPLTDPFWSNWALVIVGIVTAWIALGTLGDLKKQTAATGVSAEAAKKSAEIAEASLKLVERADVLLDAASLVHGEGMSGKDARVVLQFKNFGRTKAIEVNLALYLVIEGVPESDCTQVPPISMGAGETKDVSSPRFVMFLTEKTAQAILAGTTSLRFKGEAKYQDIFGGDHRSYYEGTWDGSISVFHIDKQETD